MLICFTLQNVNNTFIAACMIISTTHSSVASDTLLLALKLGTVERMWLILSKKFASHFDISLTEACQQKYQKTQTCFRAEKKRGREGTVSSGPLSTNQTTFIIAFLNRQVARKDLARDCLNRCRKDHSHPSTFPTRSKQSGAPPKDTVYHKAQKLGVAEKDITVASQRKTTQDASKAWVFRGLLHKE